MTTVVPFILMFFFVWEKNELLLLGEAREWLKTTKIWQQIDFWGTT
jgi:hypothetical protein